MKGPRMRHTSLRVVAVGTIAALLLAGLSLSAAVAAATSASPARQHLTLFHWWTSPSESAALGALIQLFRAKYPDVTVDATRSPEGGAMRSLFSVINKQGEQTQALDAFQMYAGYAAKVFYDAGLLSPIDDLWASDKLDGVIPPVIRDLNKFNGHYYSVPVNVHRTNVVWYNKPLLDKYNIHPNTLTTWDAFFAATETLRAGGVKNPIQMGLNWTAKTVFEGIVASEGIDTYENWINGTISAPDDARLIRAWTIFNKYLAFVNKDHSGVEWDAAVRRVMNGEGAFCIMGDWAHGEFRMAGKVYGKDYGAFLVPGTKAMFGLGVDTFQHPKGIPDQTNSIRWLRLVASREGQDAFNPLKGSISARSDADITRYDPYQRTAIADLKSARFMYPTLSSAVPEAFNAHLQQDLATFMEDQDIGKATAGVASGAKQLAGRYSRVWHLARTD
jgi:glucose/mannose transport system substrate-binding protein